VLLSFSFLFVGVFCAHILLLVATFTRLQCNAIDVVNMETYISSVLVAAVVDVCVSDDGWNWDV
jgi:hypothetical protein